MMIGINATLRCDRCKLRFGSSDHRDFLMRKHVEALRSAAARKGWARFRVKNTAPNGDYCPECVKAIGLEKAEGARKAVR